MGAILSYLWGNTVRDDDPDSTTSLTSKDKYILSTTWKKLSSEETSMETGIALFLNLFEKYPQYQQLFPFKDIPREQLKTNARFKAHCVTVIYSLTSIVDSINTPSVLEHLLYKQGVNHVPRKVPRNAYEEIKQVLMDMFAQSMNQEELKSWDKFLDLGFGIMVKGADSVK